MAYKKVGLVAVFDTAQFLPNVTKFLGSIDKMNKSVTEAAASTGAMNAPVAALGKGFGTLSLVVGALVSSGIFISLGNQLKKAIEQAAVAAKTFQLLEQRFTTLAARDYMREYGVNVTEALEKTKGSAGETIEWLRKLSVTTPYTVESLASLYTFAQAAGFTTAEVKVLAQTIGDFAAGMGLTTEHVDRIIWNFSQMKSAGRVLGRELRDLGNSMVPVDYLLEKLAYEFKVTKEEMKAMLQSGAVDADKFIQTFNEMSTEEFEGAMERVSNTWYFAKANMKDFIDTMLGLDIIKPTLDELSAMMNKFLQSLMSDEARRSTILLGLSLKEAFLTVTDTIKNYILPSLKEFAAALGIAKPTALGFAKGILNIGFAMRMVMVIASKVISHIAKFIDTVTNTTEDRFDDTARDSYGWGANIIIMFAQGMASAIGFVLDALSAVADVFIKWLTPGSPPLLLPDLTEWGAGAMMAYMDGWKEADFTVFDDIASMIEKYIKSFDLEPGDALTRIFGSREQLAEIIANYDDLANVSSDTIAQITDAAGIGSQTMNDYIAAMFNLQSVLKDSAEAEAILGFEIGQLDTGLENVIDTFQEAKDAALAYQGVGSEAILAYVDALEQMNTAQTNVSSAQNELNNVTEYYDDLLASLYAQQNKLNDDLENSNRLKVIDKTLASVILTADERERLELEKRGILLKREIRDTELAKDAAVEAANDKVDVAQAAFDAAEASAEAQKKLAEDILKATQDQIEGQVQAYEHLLNIVLENLALIKDAKDKLGGVGGTGDIGEDLSFGGGDPATDIDDISAGIQEALDRLKKELEDKWNNLTAGLVKPFEPLIAQIDEFSKKIAFFSHVTWPRFVQDLKDNPLKLVELIVGGISVAVLADAIRRVVVPGLVLGLQANLAGLGLKLKALAPGLAALFANPLLGALIAGTALLIIVAKNYGDEAALAAKQLGVIVGYYVSEWFKDIAEKFTAWVNERVADFLDWSDRTSKIVLDWVNDSVDTVNGWIEDIEKFFADWASNVGETIETWVSDTVEDFNNWITDTVKDISDWGKDVGQSIKDWSDNAAEDISNWATQAGKDISTWVANAGADISTWVTNAGADISEWVTNAGQDVSEWVTTAGEDISTWATTAGEDISTWATDAVDDIATWATDTGQDILDWVENLGTNIADFFKSGGEADQLISDFLSFGWDIINGIIDGLWDKAQSLWDAIKDIIRRALTKAEDEADISSPSKKFKRQGNLWISGLTQGIAESSSQLENTITSSVRNLNNKLQIASPSELLADSGKEIALGFSEGIERASYSVTDAMLQMGEELISVAEAPSLVDKFELIGESWILGIREGMARNSNMLTDFLFDLIPASFHGAAGNRLVMPAASSSFAVPTKTNTYNQVINISMNPTYENVQSPSSVYYDLTAALASIRR